MEQRLDATYLKTWSQLSGRPPRRSSAAGLGAGVFLAAWGASLLWRYTPPEIAVRVANPEVRIAQDAHHSWSSRTTPFVVAAPATRLQDSKHRTAGCQSRASRRSLPSERSARIEFTNSRRRRDKARGHLTFRTCNTVKAALSRDGATRMGGAGRR